MIESGVIVTQIDTETGLDFETAHYVHRFMQQIMDADIVFDPGGKPFNFGTTPEPIGLPQAQQLLDEHIYQLDGKAEHTKALSNVVAFIAYNSESNADGHNPYDPTTPWLAEEFEASHGPVEQAIARSLYAYEEALETQKELARRSSRNITLGIKGQAAAGKTTFLHTVETNLRLSQAAIQMQKSEPEDILNYYPGAESAVIHQFSKHTSRGKEATYGSESVACFAADTTGSIVHSVTIHGQGGHIRAEKFKVEPDALAFFVDYTLMQEFANLDIETPPDTILSNNEQVSECIIGTLAHLAEWQSTTVPKIGVLTKLPLDRAIDEDTFSLINRAYRKAKEYFDIHAVTLHKTIKNVEGFGATVTLPDLDYTDFVLSSKPETDLPEQEVDTTRFSAQAYHFTEVYAPGYLGALEEDPTNLNDSSSSDIHDLGNNQWLAIHNDPERTGSIEVLAALTRLASEANMQPLRFGEEEIEHSTHYKTVLK